MAFGKTKITKEMYAMFNGNRCGDGNKRTELISEFHISEQIMGCATSLFGFCSRQRRPHSFRINTDTIQPLLQNTFHHHSRGKMYALNYQLAAASNRWDVDQLISCIYVAS